MRLGRRRGRLGCPSSGRPPPRCQQRLNQRNSDFVASSETLEDCYAKGSHSILREIARKSHLKSRAFTWRRKSPATDKTALNKGRSVIRSSAGTNDRAGS